MLRRLVVMLLVLASLTGAAMAAEVEFNYNGRVRVHGQDFDGTGLFKFVLTSADGQQTFWSNDGVSLTGDEPTSAVAATVTRGFFSVNIGDTDLAGMAALDPAVFSADASIRMRVWFSDGSHGFQRLLPDSEVLNPYLLSIKTLGAQDIYVNPGSGNDAWPGYSASRPKRTIQAAWQAIPSLVETTVTVHLAPGTYYESPILSGKVVAYPARIFLSGDVENPEAYRISGAAGATTSETAQRTTVLTVHSQQGLEVQGLTLRRGVWYGMRIMNASGVNMTSCVVERCYWVGEVNANSEMHLTGSELRDCDGGLRWTNQSSGTIRNCVLRNFTGLQAHGLASWTQSSITVIDTRITNVLNPVHAQLNASIILQSGNVLQTGTVPITARYNSVVWGITNGVSVSGFSQVNSIIEGSRTSP